MVFGLDPAAAYAEAMPIRPDLYLLWSPILCHPPLFTDTEAANSASDWFGVEGHSLRVWCALSIMGPRKTIPLARNWLPICSHRFLRIASNLGRADGDPGTGDCRIHDANVRHDHEASDGSGGVKFGIPEQAAWDFCLGHIRTELAIVFGVVLASLSPMVRSRRLQQNMQRIFRDDWKGRDSIPALREVSGDICKT